MVSIELLGEEALKYMIYPVLLQPVLRDVVISYVQTVPVTFTKNTAPDIFSATKNC